MSMQHHSDRRECAAEALQAQGCYMNAPCTQAVKQELVDTTYDVYPSQASSDPADVQVQDIKLEPSTMGNFETDMFSPPSPTEPSTQLSGGLDGTEWDNKTADIKLEPLSLCNFERDSVNPPSPIEPSTQLSGGPRGTEWVNRTVRTRDENHSSSASGVTVKTERLLGNFERDRLNPLSLTEPSTQLSGELSRAEGVNRPVRTENGNHNSSATGVTVKTESENTIGYQDSLSCVTPEVTDSCVEVLSNKRVKSEPESVFSSSDVKGENPERPELDHGFSSTRCNDSTNSFSPTASSSQWSRQHCEATGMNSMLQASIVTFKRSSEEQPGLDYSENRVLQVKQEPVSVKQEQEWSEYVVTADQVTSEPSRSQEQAASHMIFERKPVPCFVTDHQVTNEANRSHEEMVSELVFQGKPDPGVLDKIMMTEPHRSDERVISEVVSEAKPDPGGSGFAPKTTSDLELDFPSETTSDYLSNKEKEVVNTDTCQQSTKARYLTARKEVAHGKVQCDDKLRKQFSIRNCHVPLSRLSSELEQTLQSQGSVTPDRAFYHLCHVTPSSQLGGGRYGTERVKSRTAASKTAAQRVVNPLSSVPPSTQLIGRGYTIKGVGNKSKTAVSTGITCDLCESKLSSPGNLSAHIRTKHQKQRPYECHLCDQRFAFPSHLADHVRLHTGERPFACSQCQMKFTRKSHLTSHMRTHTGEKRYHCQHCPAKFDRRYSLHCHLGTVHKQAEFISDGKRKYICEVCKKTFLYLSHLKSHLVTHSKAKPYTCETCGKECSSSSDLAKHIRVHSGVRPYECELCEETFMQAGELTRHMARCHPAVFKARHVCKHCGRKFALASGLTRHMFTHVKID